MRKPAIPTRLAIQRIRFFCSLGTSRSRIAPASGRKSTVLRIWLVNILSQSLSVNRTVPSASRIARGHSLTHHIIAEDDQRSHNNEQRVALHQSGLEQADRIGKYLDAEGAKPDGAVD